MIHPPVISRSSPLYPLPADYHDLTSSGQRQARVAASRQWLLPDPPLLPGETLPVARGAIAADCLWFFDAHYLHPDPDVDFDPGFYDMTPLRTPSFHWDLVRDWGANRLNVAMAPRGSAKTTLMRKDMILRMTSCPSYSIAYATSTHDNAQATGEMVRDQLYHNSRIHDDFSPEYDGPLRPTRGSKLTGINFFFCNNRSWLRCLSAESRIRSLRPRRFRLDDPEYDEKATTSVAILRSYMERLLFNLVLPMTFRAGCGVDWVGTFVSKRHYLFHAMQLISTPEGERAADARFNFWARRLIDACYEDPTTGVTSSCWPEMWPIDSAERTRLSLDPTTLTLEEIKVQMGAAAFNQEMRGRPGTSDEQFFKLDPDPRGRHSYWFEAIDDLVDSDPFASTTLLCYQSPTGSLVRTPLGAFLRTARTFMTVDTAYTEKAHSDRRCYALLALTTDNLLFCLDLWSDRKPDAVLVNRAFAACALWQCPLLFVEVVKESLKLYTRFRSAVSTRLTETMNLARVPAIRDIRPGTLSKTAKIEGLDTRFEHGLIKLPLFRRSTAPWWTRLFDQIESFNPEASDGGLQHDDELDCLSMAYLAIKSRLRKTNPTDATPIDVLSEMRAGRLTLPSDPTVSYASGLPLHLLSAEDLAPILSRPTPPPAPTPLV